MEIFETMYEKNNAVQIAESERTKDQNNIHKHISVIQDIQQKLFARFLKIENPRILCVGARNCNESRAFHQVFPYIPICINSIDISGEKNKIRLDWHKRLGQCIVEYMDMNVLSFKDNTFDVVYLHHSLNHITTPWVAASEINRVVKKDGIVYIIVPLEENPSELNPVAFRSDKDVIGLCGLKVKDEIYNEIIDPEDDELPFDEVVEGQELRIAFTVEK